MVKEYKAILLLHSHDAGQFSKAILELERTAHLDGYYFAFALRPCNLCKECKLKREMIVITLTR
jgi:predicted metal-binding protein